MNTIAGTLEQVGRFIFSTNPLDNLTALQEHQRALYRIAQLERDLLELQAMAGGHQADEIQDGAGQ